MAKHKPIPLRSIPHFPSNISQESDEDEVIFLSINQLSQELINTMNINRKKNEA